ncbi:hypothetical protein PV328_000623, partial [Microctonus aethiopoides]
MEALQVAQHDSNDDDDDDDDNSVENDDEVMKIDLFEMVHARDSLDPYQTYGPKRNERKYRGDVILVLTPAKLGIQCYVKVLPDESCPTEVRVKESERIEDKGE